MEILKQGDLSRLKAKKNFACDYCGCEFIADNTEYKAASCLEASHDGIEAKCECPTCGKMVYRHR